MFHALRKGRAPAAASQPGNLGEAAGVVRASDRAAMRAAGRSGLGAAARAWVALDVIRIGRGCALRARHEPEFRTV